MEPFRSGINRLTGKKIALTEGDMMSLVHNYARRCRIHRLLSVVSSVIVFWGLLFLAPVVTAQNDYVLALDTVSGEPGTLIDFDVSLTNGGTVSGFNLLIGYDPTSLWPQNIDLEGTRAADFEYFSYQFDAGGVPGNVRLTGIADEIGGGSTDPLAPGDGSIANLRFRIINDISYAGMWIPVWLEFSDPITQDDNTLTDGYGGKIEQSQIDYYDGWVEVLYMGEVVRGDINLNGFPYEVSDYVYFTNYFMYPSIYYLDALQLANSDMNQDGVAATISDLVFLINKIVSGNKVSSNRGDPDLPAGIHIDFGAGQAGISYSTDFEVGGLLLSFEVEDTFDPGQLILRQQQMEVMLHQQGSLVRVLVYSPQGATMPAGDYPVIDLLDVQEVSVRGVDLAAFDGRTAAAVYVDQGLVPELFSLHPNFPNPFNPTTTIEFELSRASWVELTVYDLLGRRVSRLLDEQMDPGIHQAVFDFRTAEGAATGVYFYRLNTDYGQQTKKMMLLK